MRVVRDFEIYKRSIQNGLWLFFCAFLCLWSAEALATKDSKCSCSREWVQTFRGNQNRSFYGTGFIPAKLKTRWKFRTRWIRDSRLRGYGGRKLIWRGTGWSGQAAVVGDRVWVSSVGGILYCLNRHNGRLIWKFRAGLSIKSSVTYWNNRVYFGSRSNRLYCLNASTGKLLWSFRTPRKNVDSTPLIWNGWMYWGSEDFHLYAMNPLNGKVRWKYKTMGSIESSPMIYNGKIYINSYDGHLHCLDLKTGHLMWRFRTGDDTDTTPTFHRGKIYFGSENGTLYAIRAETGELVWKRQTNGGVWSTPAVAGRRVFVGSNDRRLYGFDAETGRSLWQYRTGDGVWASIVHVAGRLLVGDWAGFLHVVRAVDGERITRRRMGMKFRANGNHIVSTASIVKGRVYIGSRDGHFYCLEGPRKRSKRQTRMSLRWRKRFGQDREAIVSKLDSLSPSKINSNTGWSSFQSGLIRQRLIKALSSRETYQRLLVARLLRKNKLPQKNALVLLKYLFRDGADHVRLEAIRAAFSYGKKAALLAEPLLKDRDERIRAETCQLQGKLGRKSVYLKIIPMLWDRYSEIQTTCARALVLLGKTRLARRTLRRFLFGGRHYHRFRKKRGSRVRFGCPNRVAKYFLYHTKAGITRRKPREKKSILHALLTLHSLGDSCAKKHIFSRWYGCEGDRTKGYCSIYSDWQGWIKRLTPLSIVPLESSKRQFRALKRYGLPRYKDNNLRANAFLQLLKMKTPKRVPILLKALRREHYSVLRILAARGLAQVPKSSTRKALRRALSSDKCPDVRIEAAKSLAHSYKKQAITSLHVQLKREKSKRVKAAIAAVMAQLGSSLGHQILKQMLNSSSRSARCHALLGLVTFSQGLELSKKVLQSKEPFMRLCAFRAIRSLVGSTSLRPITRKQVQFLLGELVRHKDPAVSLRAGFAWMNGL